MLQGSYIAFQQARGLRRYDAPAGASRFCLYDNWVLNLTGNSFWTLAPRAYITYYQARGLSGHTSPCGECVLIDPCALNDCKDYQCARGLSRPLLGEWFSSATCELYSCTVERHLFRPCYKVHTSPSSKLGDYVGTMHLLVHLISPVQ